MSEHIGEASIRIRPDVTKFREELIAELTAATKGVAVKIPAVAAAAGTAKVAVAQNALAASSKTAGAAAAELAASERQLAEATRLAEQATAQLATIESAGELATTDLAASKAKLSAAQKAVTISTKAEQAAIATSNAELIANAAATKAAALAAVDETKALATEAVAHARTGKAAAIHAAQEHAVISGARAAGASLTGLRGATLSTSGAFLAGAIGVKLFEESIHEASREQEAAVRTNKVFGASAHEVEEGAKGMATSFGLSTAAALDFESKLGNLFHNAGFAQEEAARLSEELVKDAADLAAFQNVPVADTLRAIQLGLVGNSRGLRQYQIELNQARVSQVALKESGKDNVKQLTQEDKIRARVILLQEQLGRVQGSAADRAHDLAQEEKIAKAELANFGAVIGRIALPKVTELLGEVNLLIRGLGFLGSAAEKVGSKVGGSQFGHFLKDVQTIFSPTASPQSKLGVLKEIKDLAFPKDVNRDFKELNFQGEKFSGTMQELHLHAEGLFKAKEAERLAQALQDAEKETERLIIKASQVSYRNAERDLDRLREKLLDVKIAGGGVGDELAVLQQQRAAAQRAVDAASLTAIATQGRSGHDTAIKNRRQAKADLAEIIDQIRQDKKQITDDAIQAAQEIAQEIKDAQDAAQAALDQADQNALDLITVLGRPFDIKRLRVEATKSLEDDVQFEKDFQALTRAQIAIARTSINDAKLRAATIHDLTLALVQSEIAEKELEAQRKQAAADRKRARIEAQETSLDLDIDFAQTTKNKNAERRAHEAKIRFLLEQQAHTKRGTNEWKKLRNEIASERAAIKALNKDLDKEREDLKALQFEFLQTQSGFAANLLSNILPTSTVAGTVGGGGISTPTGGTNIGAGGPSRPPDAQRRDIATASGSASASRGASAGQMSTLIAINRNMLNVLSKIAGRAAHPEATNQRIESEHAMDYFQYS